MILKHGDCHELIKTVADNSIDFVYFDPPYGITSCSWDISLEWEILWPQIWRVLKGNGAVAIHSSQPFTPDLINSQRKHFKYWWVWHKNKVTGFLNAHHQPLRNTEEICLFYKKQCTYNPQMTDLDRHVFKQNVDTKRTFVKKLSLRGMKEYKGRFPKTLLEFNTKGTSESKSAELVAHIVRTYMNKNETLLDLTMHKGIIGEAALREEMNYIGFEKDLDFFNKAQERLGEI